MLFLDGWEAAFIMEGNRFEIFCDKFCYSHEKDKEQRGMDCFKYFLDLHKEKVYISDVSWCKGRLKVRWKDIVKEYVDDIFVGIYVWKILPEPPCFKCYEYEETFADIVRECEQE